MLRISVITLIRTDTTLDLSQKAEKGKSLLRLPAAESRFSGPQAMTLSRQFYDPGEGAAKRRPLARAWAPQGRRAPFSGPAYRRRAAPAAFCSCAAASPRPESGGAKGCPNARSVPPRATRLAAPTRLAASAWPRACFTLRSAAFTSRSLAAAPPPRTSSRKDCQHRTALRRRRDQANAARIVQRDPVTTKTKKVQPATAAAHTTHLT